MDEAVSFSVFVKAWYDKNTYAVFKSNGVIIDSKRPAVLNILGSSVGFLSKHTIITEIFMLENLYHLIYSMFMKLDYSDNDYKLDER